MISRVFFFLLYLSSCAAFAQDAVEEDSEFNLLPDTFKIYSPEVFFVNHLDSLHGKLFDSIQKPKAYFIDNYHSGGGYGWLIAIKQKEGYQVFNPFENSMAYARADALTFERLDFNGKGNDELVIKWEFRTGHSGWQGGVYESSSGILIWDLDKKVRYLDLITSTSLERWWAQYDEDTTGLVNPDELKIVDSGQENECFLIDVQLAKKAVVLVDSACGSEEISEAIEASTVEVKRYDFSKKGLILNHQEQ